MGVYKGYKQSPEHVAKRMRYGKDHHSWKGDDITKESGRSRAIRHYPKKPCELCGESQKRVDRHHKDGNTANNNPENIQFLCRKCHMEIDGRLDKVKNAMKRVQPMGVKARWGN